MDIRTSNDRIAGLLRSSPASIVSTSILLSYLLGWEGSVENMAEFFGIINQLTLAIRRGLSVSMILLFVAKRRPYKMWTWAREEF